MSNWQARAVRRAALEVEFEAEREIQRRRLRGHPATEPIATLETLPGETAERDAILYLLKELRERDLRS